MIYKIKLLMIFLIAFFGAIFIYYWCDGDEKNKPKNISTEYNNIDIENPFVYINISELKSLLKKDSIIFICSKEDNNCQEYSKILNDYLKNNKINTIYYLDIEVDRKDKTLKYSDLVNYVRDYLTIDKNFEYNIDVPSFIFSKDSSFAFYEVINNNWEDKKQIKELKNKLNEYLSIYIEEEI